MTPQDFESTVAREGFTPVRRTLDANLDVESHDHAWDTRGLVVAGTFVIDCGGDARAYTAGEVFEVAAGIAHTERTGPEGAQLIVGRRMRG